jgi:hypothetical protein
MGTRARVEIFDDDECVVSIYRQFDGYPSGLGQELAEFLSDITVVNGLGDESSNKIANGMGCLAAQLVKFLKDGPGNVYLHKPMTKDGESGEEFIYRISGGYVGTNGTKPLLVQVSEGDVTAFGLPNDPGSFKGVFSGNVKKFAAWCKKH